MNRLTHAMFHKEVQWHLLGEMDNFVTILLQIHSGICAKIIEIERDLTKLLRT